MMSNWDQALKYQKEYNEGFMVGSSDFENKRYTDSIEGRIVKLQESLRTLVTTTISSDMFKDFLDGATKVVNVINDIIGAWDNMGIATPAVFGTLAGMFSTIKQKATQSGEAVQGANNQIKGFGNAFQSSFSGSLLDRAIKGMKSFVSQVKQVGTNIKNANGVTGKFKEGIKGIANSSIVGKMGSLAGNVLSLAGNMLLMTGISIAVSKAFEAINNKIHETEIKIEKLKDSIAETQSSISTNTSNLNSLSDIADEYEKLAKKTEKSSEEQERFNELTNEIAELMPELVVG